MNSSDATSSPSCPEVEAARPTMRRGRRRFFHRSAATLVAASSASVLLFSPSFVCAVEEGRGGLRGASIGGPQPPRRRELDENLEGRISADGESPMEEEEEEEGDDETDLREERTLAGRGDEDHENVLVQIDPFATDLLEIHFPFGIKNDNRLCSAASLHASEYLSDAVDENLLDLGLHCEKRQQRIGQETRWVLDVHGEATFDNPPQEDVNVAIHQAFVGTNKELLLEKIYSDYEVVKEKREWDAEQDYRLSRRRQGKKPKKNKKKGKKNKKKNKNKNKKKPMKQMLGGGGQSTGGSELNLMGYVSGSQGNGGGGGGKGYEIINGDIHVEIVGGGGRGGGGGNKDRSKKKPEKIQQMSSSSQNNKPQKGPKQQSYGGKNVMGYVSGSQGSGSSGGNKGYEIKNGDIHVQVGGG